MTLCGNLGNHGVSLKRRYSYVSTEESVRVCSMEFDGVKRCHT